MIPLVTLFTAMATLLGPSPAVGGSPDLMGRSLMAPAAETVKLDAFAVHQRPAVSPAANDLRVAYGKQDARGCARLVVWRGERRVLRIPSHDVACSRTRKQAAVFSRLYFDWTVIKVSGEGRKETTRKRTDVWVTDGTVAGTVKVTTLIETEGRGLDTCESRWARAGYQAIAGAQWCRERRSGDWVSGRVAIILGERVVRHLPIPRMLDFRVAGRRIVTTGQDANGRELWIHDGHMTRVDLRAGPMGSNPRKLQDLGRRVRFVANDGRGLAIWESDGTVAGTRRIRLIG